MIQTVKRFGGFCSSALSKTAFARARVTPFDPRPHRPPTQTTGICASRRDVATSRYSGSPNEPASFVR